MEKIELKFSATPTNLVTLNEMVVVLTLDEKGKSYKVKCEGGILGEQKEISPLPQRVLNAFTENAINKILSKDEIPNESDVVVLDGYSYNIRITKEDLCKEYDADDASIETYPLLKYLASWYRKSK